MTSLPCLNSPVVSTVLRIKSKLFITTAGPCDLKPLPDLLSLCQAPTTVPGYPGLGTDGPSPWRLQSRSCAAGLFPPSGHSSIPSAIGPFLTTHSNLPPSSKSQPSLSPFDHLHSLSSPSHITSFIFFLSASHICKTTPHELEANLFSSALYSLIIRIDQGMQ